MWEEEVKEGCRKVVMKGVGEGKVEREKDVKKVLMWKGRRMKKVDVRGLRRKEMRFEGKLKYKGGEEGEYVLEEIWGEVKEKL